MLPMPPQLPTLLSAPPPRPFYTAPESPSGPTELFRMFSARYEFAG